MALLFGSGLVTTVVWRGPLLSVLATGQPPERRDIYTGRVTDALDLGVITPSTILVGRFVVLAGLSRWVLASLLQQVPSRDQPPTDPPHRSDEPSDRTY